MARPGRVSLVGAGPGDPELITVRGLRRLREADVVVHDRLVSTDLLDEAPASARRIDVGKSPGRQPWPQSRINTLLVAEALRGRNVVRLKGGDPFLFGRGAEECRTLAEAGVPYEVVPGVSSALAAPAYAGIPVTHRDHASAVTIVTGHTCGESADRLDWDALSRAGTLVFLMGLGRLRHIAETLRAHGRAPDTPVAVIACATTAEQEVVRGTLNDIADRARGMESPATIVIGSVSGLHERLDWFDPTTAPRVFHSDLARPRRIAEADHVA